jgi:ATP-dependent Lon protease
MKELQRLQRMSPMAADYSVTRNYLEWLVVLPWAKSSGGDVDINKAKEVLDEDHYDLRRSRTASSTTSRCAAEPEDERPDPLLLRTSRRGQDLARQVDRARLGRKFVRAVAGRHARRGRDPRPPAHLHRRAARTDHPGHPPRRDQRPGLHARRDRQGGRATSAAIPSSALLEALDPEQNNSFRDNYLDVPSICRRCCSSPPRTSSTPFPSRCATAWRSSTCMGTRKRTRRTSPSST